MKVIILCGGQGTRAYPYTRHMPKALMPVAGLPVVEQCGEVGQRFGPAEFPKQIDRRAADCRVWRVLELLHGLPPGRAESQQQRVFWPRRHVPFRTRTQFLCVKCRNCAASLRRRAS